MPQIPQQQPPRRGELIAELIPTGRYELKEEHFSQLLNWGTQLGVLNVAPERASQAAPWASEHEEDQRAQLRAELYEAATLSTAALTAELKRRKQAAELTGTLIKLRGEKDQLKTRLTTPPVCDVSDVDLDQQAAFHAQGLIMGARLQELSGAQGAVGTLYLRVMETVNHNHHYGQASAARRERFWTLIGEATEDIRNVIRGSVVCTEGAAAGLDKTVTTGLPAHTGRDLDTRRFTNPTSTKVKQFHPVSPTTQKVCEALQSGQAWMPPLQLDDVMLASDAYSFRQTLMGLLHHTPVNPQGDAINTGPLTDLTQWDERLQGPRPPVQNIRTLLVLAEISPLGWNTNKARTWMQRRLPGDPSDPAWGLIDPLTDPTRLWLKRREIEHNLAGSESLSYDLKRMLQIDASSNEKDQLILGQLRQLETVSAVTTTARELAQVMTQAVAPVLIYSTPEQIRWSQLMRALGEQAFMTHLVEFI